MAIECTVPELGENIETATVVEVFVAVGDEVAIEQSVLSLETDKAEFEMPSNAAGKVSEIMVKPGQDVKVGQAVLRLEGAAQVPENVDTIAKESTPGKPEPRRLCPRPASGMHPRRRRRIRGATKPSPRANRRQHRRPRQRKQRSRADRWPCPPRRQCDGSLGNWVSSFRG